MSILKSMRLPPEGTLLGGPQAVQSRPDFPYGLSINLDEDSIKLLNIGELPEVGEVLELHARVVVKSVSSDQVEGQGINRRASLQITDMALEGMKEGKSAAEIVYTEDN